MTQDEAKAMLEAARQRVEAAQEELDATRTALYETKITIANGLGPFKVGDYVQRKDGKKMYQITTAKIFTAGLRDDAELYAIFHAYPLKGDGTPSSRGEHYITVLQADEWQVVSLPQGGE